MPIQSASTPARPTLVAMPALRERASARRFERDCERLRPLGEAYVLRHFSGQLGRADAEDAAAEVLVRIHRQAAAGHPPENLRATFFTGVRNQATELLRERARRRSVRLDAAGEIAAKELSPAELVEARESSIRFQEALARLRPNQREAILLRFYLGFTVPELSRHFEISLAAAKKLIRRATKQVEKRAAAIDGAEYCPEMRRVARRSLLERHSSATADEAEAEILRKHFEHCGTCKSFIANFHYGLHEVATAALFGMSAGDQLSGKVSVADRAVGWIDHLADGGHALGEKARLAAFRVSDGLHGSEPGSAGALAGTGQRIAAICGAGAIAAGGCAATGVVGPGLSSPADHGGSEKPLLTRPAEPTPVTTVSTQSVPVVQSEQPTTTQQVVKPVQQVNKELYGGGATSSSSGSTSGSRDFAAPASSSSSSGGGGGGSSGSRENFGL